MKYPFEFEECLLTDDLFHTLGFEFWGGSGDFYDAGIEGIRYRIIQGQFEPDDTLGYISGPKRMDVARFMTSDFKTMYFLHEMYEDIVSRCSTEDKTKLFQLFEKHNLSPYIESYLKYKNELQEAKS